MSQQVADITIQDFAAWDARLTPIASVAAPTAADVSWVVAARSSPPMLPVMRGGEIVLVSPAVIEIVADELPRMSDELVRAGVAAIGLPAGGALPEFSAAVPLVMFASDATVESTADELNRSLADLRSLLYRAGGEISDIITEQLRGTPTPARLLDVVAQRFGFEVLLTDRSGHQRHQVGGAVDMRVAFSHDVVDGSVLLLQPRDPRHRAIARMAVERLATGINVMLDRAEADRPRGSARTALLNRLLRDDRSLSTEERRTAEGRLGLPPNARYRVAVLAGARGSADFARHFSSLGTATHAGDVQAGQAYIIEMADPGSSSSAVLKRLAGDTAGRSVSVGVSGEIIGPSDLPGAAQQAIDALERAKVARGTPVAVYDDPLALGIRGLLLRLRDDPALQEFVAAVLGDLPGEDRRGVLAETLEVYVECGGAQSETAERLGIHRNTLSYRLRKIADLTGSDPGSPEGRLALHLALIARRLRTTD